MRRFSADGAPAGEVSADEAARILEARMDRWRKVPDLLGRPGVDASRHAARRRGYRPPAEKPLRTHLGAEALSAPGVIAADYEPPDTLRVAFIRVEFATDRGGSASSGDGRFDLSRPGDAQPPVDRPPHNRNFYLDHFEALHRYYDAQSYGRTIVVGDVWPRERDLAYRCSDMADFGPWEFSHDEELYLAAVHLFRSMLFAADTQSVLFGDRIPWDQYDRYVVIHAGSDFQSDIRQDSPEDIPSFTLTVEDTDAVIFADSTDWNREHPIDRAAIVPETINQDDYYGAINGVIAHECGHLFFGFADLYDTASGFPVVGLWSLMDSGNLVGTTVLLPDQTKLFATGLLPPSIDPWQRAFATDTLAFPEFAYGDTVALQNSERHPDMRRITLTSDEYLLIENRWLSPADLVELDQADSTRVVLGPKNPDRFEYDALLPAREVDDTFLPAAGILVWHIDESVIPSTEFTFPCDTSRANYDCGFNSNPARLAISVIEADALDDLGDLSSPYIIGSPRDPWFKSNNASLSDTTRPALRAHVGTRPHVRLDFLDEPLSTMRFTASRTWQLPNWPVRAPFPPGGPRPLAIDVDGDRLSDVCWAGGPEGSADSAAIFVLRGNGDGLIDTTAVFSRALDRRPHPVMAAISQSNGLSSGPAVLAVTTTASGPDTTSPGGRAWLIDEHGQPVAGWPARLPSIVTTPPVIVAVFRDTFVYVGCADGRVYALDLDGTVQGISTPALGGAIAGRLAAYPNVEGGTVDVAAGSVGGDVGVFVHQLDVVPVAAGGTPTRAAGGVPDLPLASSRWPVQLGDAEFAPDFLWIDFGGSGPAAQSNDCFSGALTLVVHHADALWAYCLAGEALPGWPGATGDTLASLAAGDPDGDGVPEVITQSTTSRIIFWDSNGHPSPGWPKRGTVERFRSDSAPLAAYLTPSGGSHTITMNASGIVDALDRNGHQAEGWPLATGLDAVGDPLLADLDGDHYLELVAPDAHGLMYAYSLPTRDSVLIGTAWPMLGGDPQRTSALTAEHTPQAPAAAAGPLVHGSLKAYPNPARRRPVQFSYTLTEPGEVEFRILDASGHEVARFERRARQTDNVEVWDPGALPAGLYLARLKFKGATSDHVETVPVGLLR